MSTLFCAVYQAFDYVRKLICKKLGFFNQVTALLCPCCCIHLRPSFPIRLIWFAFYFHNVGIVWRGVAIGLCCTQTNQSPAWISQRKRGAQTRDNVNGTVGVIGSHHRVQFKTPPPSFSRSVQSTIFQFPLVIIVFLLLNYVNSILLTGTKRRRSITHTVNRLLKLHNSVSIIRDNQI